VGTNFHGSQIQKQKRTLQGDIEKALNTLYQEDISVTLASRLDSGVHAQNFVLNYKTNKNIQNSGLIKGLNGITGPDIEIINAEVVTDDFNARHAAKQKEYRYFFCQQKELPVYLWSHVAKVSFNPHLKELNGLAKMIEGEHDFINFRNTGSQTGTTIRKIKKCTIKRRIMQNMLNGKQKITLFEFKIIGKSFMYKMIRNIVGAIFEVVQKNYSREQFGNLLSSSPKAFPFSPAPAKGLSLSAISY